MERLALDDVVPMHEICVAIEETVASLSGMHPTVVATGITISDDETWSAVGADGVPYEGRWYVDGPTVEVLVENPTETWRSFPRAELV